MHSVARLLLDRLLASSLLLSLLLVGAGCREDVVLAIRDGATLDGGSAQDAGSDGGDGSVGPDDGGDGSVGADGSMTDGGR